MLPEISSFSTHSSLCAQVCRLQLLGFREGRVGLASSPLRPPPSSPDKRWQREKEGREGEQGHRGAWFLWVALHSQSSAEAVRFPWWPLIALQHCPLVRLHPYSSCLLIFYYLQCLLIYSASCCSVPSVLVDFTGQDQGWLSFSPCSCTVHICSLGISLIFFWSPAVSQYTPSHGQHRIHWLPHTQISWWPSRLHSGKAQRLYLTLAWVVSRFRKFKVKTVSPSPG